MQTKTLNFSIQLCVAMVVGYGGVIFATQTDPAAYIGDQITRFSQVGECNIKGNISVNTGERIYHTPRQRYYHETRIDISKGERWFCSEADAMAAGWRRSRQ